MTFLVCDFVDAFFKMPLLPIERKYFATSLGEDIFIWARVGQGSLNGPTVFGRLSAMVGRFSQSLFDLSEARVHIYTDDPHHHNIRDARKDKTESRDANHVLAGSWILVGLSQGPAGYEG